MNCHILFLTVSCKKSCRCLLIVFTGEPVPRSLEGLFVYEEKSTAPPANDTIVVEQWTVIEVWLHVWNVWKVSHYHIKSFFFNVLLNGFWFVSQGSDVKTDYGPLLHTLAEFGWLLTCVLPTPIIRHDRWDPHSTSHIIMFIYTTLPFPKLAVFLFLQRRESSH